MHMSDALISPVVGATMTAVSVGLGAYSIKKVKEDNKEEIIPLMGVLGAFIFAGQMINFTIPGTGSSGHIVGDLILASVIGPYATFITMGVILLIQALFFNDGGLVAYGANLFNMAFFTCFIAYPLYEKILKNKKRDFGKNLLFGAILIKLISIEFGAVAVVIETVISGKIQLPVSLFLISMCFIHLLIGFVEAIITYFVVMFIYKEKSDILYVFNENGKKYKGLSKVVMAITLISFIVAGGLSMYASSKPDGLEWSLERTVEVPESNHISVFGDYAVGGENISDSAKTAIAGIVGTTVTLGATFLIGSFMIKKRKVNEYNN